MFRKLKNLRAGKGKFSVQEAETLARLAGCWPQLLELEGWQSMLDSRDSFELLAETEDGMPRIETAINPQKKIAVVTLNFSGLGLTGMYWRGTATCPNRYEFFVTRQQERSLG